MSVTARRLAVGRSVFRPHAATLITMATTPTTQTRLPTCYRHPDRETGLACSECGRPICTECMTAAPVGLRCPDHAGKNRARAPRVAGRQLVLPQTRIGGTEALVTKALIAINVGSTSSPPFRATASTLQEARCSTMVPLRPVRGAGRLVAPDHGSLPAREHHPHRLQHARPLVDRRARRAVPRPRALSRALLRVGGSPAPPARSSPPRTPSPSVRPVRSSGFSARC